MPCRTPTTPRPLLQQLPSPNLTFLVQTPQATRLRPRLALQPAQFPPTTLWRLFNTWMPECSPTTFVLPLALRHLQLFNVKSLTKLQSLLYSVALQTPPSQQTKRQDSTLLHQAPWAPLVPLRRPVVAATSP